MTVAPAMAKIDSPQLDNAARKFADASYPLMQQIDWYAEPVFTKYLADSSWTPEQLNRIISSVLKLGIEMDTDMIKRAVEAHEVALSHNIASDRFIANQADVEEIASRIAQLIVSAPQDKTMAVYKSFSDLGGIGLDVEFMEKLGGPGEVAAAYKAFIDLFQIAEVQVRA